MGKLYLVRHGQASFGAADYDQLSALGEQQSRRLGQWFLARSIRFDAVFTGTLRRHAQTLAGIEQGMHARHEAQALPGLNEYDSEAVVHAIHPGPIAAPDTPEQVRQHFRLLRDGLRQWMWTLAIVSTRHVVDLKIPVAATLTAQSEALQHEGRTVSWLINADSATILGLLAFGDTLKPSAKTAIERLHRMGVKTALLSGDNHGSAQAVASALGIDEVYAEVLPTDKAKIIAELQIGERLVAMVGDGINDAPALAAADIGIAMSTGTDVAMHAAGITLMRGDPALVADALDISRRTYAKIRQNLFWAFFYNVVGIPAAALGLLNPMIAGAAMAFSSVSVVANALLLKRWMPRK